MKPTYRTMWGQPMKETVMIPTMWTPQMQETQVALQQHIGGSPLSQIVLGKVSDRLGMDTKPLNDFAYVVSGVESSYGRNLSNSQTTAKGIYQFTDDSFVTAKNRLRNMMGELPDRIANAKNILDLSPDDQKALFFAHLSEDKGSDAEMRKFLEGGSGRDLYVKHHYKGDPDEATNKRLDEFFGSSLVSGKRQT